MPEYGWCDGVKLSVFSIELMTFLYDPFRFTSRWIINSRIFFFVSKLSSLFNTVWQDEQMKFFFPLFQFYFVAVSFVSGRKLAWKWMAIKHGVFLQIRFSKLYAGVTIRFMSVNHFTGICRKKTQWEKKKHISENEFIALVRANMQSCMATAYM